MRFDAAELPSSRDRYSVDLFRDHPVSCHEPARKTAISPSEAIDAWQHRFDAANT
jgi:hypothetical protein